MNPQFHKDFKKVNVVGTGSFGEAILCVDLRRNKNVIVKRMYNQNTNPKHMKQALNEAQILSKLNHANIIKYIDSWIEGGLLYIEMEYAEGGDIQKKIDNAKRTKVFFEETKILDWFIQICAALKHLHDQKILHRDLKTQNVFLSANDSMVKVGDFGISRLMNTTGEQADTFVGTPYYMSPELIAQRPYNNKSDIWALGVILYQLMTLRQPFEATAWKELVTQIQSCRYTPVEQTQSANRYSTEIKQIVGILLKLDPNQRPSVNNILRCPPCRFRLRQISEFYMQLPQQVLQKESLSTIDKQYYQHFPNMYTIVEAAPLGPAPSPPSARLIIQPSPIVPPPVDTPTKKTNRNIPPAENQYNADLNEFSPIPPPARPVRHFPTPNKIPTTGDIVEQRIEEVLKRVAEERNRSPSPMSPSNESAPTNRRSSTPSPIPTTEMEFMYDQPKLPPLAPQIKRKPSVCNPPSPPNKPIVNNTRRPSLTPSQSSPRTPSTPRTPIQQDSPKKSNPSTRSPSPSSPLSNGYRTPQESPSPSRHPSPPTVKRSPSPLNNPPRTATPRASPPPKSNPTNRKPSPGLTPRQNITPRSSSPQPTYNNGPTKPKPSPKAKPSTVGRIASAISKLVSPRSSKVPITADDVSVCSTGFQFDSLMRPLEVDSHPLAGVLCNLNNLVDINEEHEEEQINDDENEYFEDEIHDLGTTICGLQGEGQYIQQEPLMELLKKELNNEDLEDACELIRKELEGYDVVDALKVVLGPRKMHLIHLIRLVVMDTSSDVKQEQYKYIGNEN